jgi:hypothetical protein
LGVKRTFGLRTQAALRWVVPAQKDFWGVAGAIAHSNCNDATHHPNEAARAIAAQSLHGRFWGSAAFSLPSPPTIDPEGSAALAHEDSNLGPAD